jgi:hypothetical protein
MDSTYFLCQETFTKTLLQQKQPNIKQGIKTTERDLMLMKRKASALIFVLLISSFLIPAVAKAQPQPPNVATLGPVTFYHTDYSGNNIKILSPQNQTSYSNQIPLVFTIEVIGMFGQFGNVGYSLNDGIINSAFSFRRSS